MYKQYDDIELKKLQKVQLSILKDFIELCKEHNLNYFLVFGSALGAVRHKGFIPWDDDIDVGMLRQDYERFYQLYLEGKVKDYEILNPLINNEYACSVTHFQKKNTKFVPESMKNLKCTIGINIDIFVFDNIADSKIKRYIQSKRSWLLGRLLFLRGTPSPNIPVKGITGFLAKAICYVIHYFLVCFRISPSFIYRRLLKVSKCYNDRKTEFVTCFEDFAPLNDMIKRDKIFPMQTLSFEDIYVNVPCNNHELLKGMYGDYMKLPNREDRINHCPYILDFGENDGK